MKALMAQYVAAAIGIELKATYYRQALKNVQDAVRGVPVQAELFAATTGVP